MLKSALNFYLEPNRYTRWNWTFAFLTAVLFAYINNEWIDHGTRWLDWDFMLISGGALFIVVGIYGTHIEKRFHTVLKDIVDGGVLVSARPADDISRLLDMRIRRISMIGGIAVFAFEFLSVTFFYGIGFFTADNITFDRSTWSVNFCHLAGNYYSCGLFFVGDYFLLLAVCSFCGWLAGIRLGRCAGNGLSFRYFKRIGVEIRPIPGHRDKRAGLEPFDRFLVSQALFTLAPVLWLFLWWLLLPFWDANQTATMSYTEWQWPFIAIWLLALAFLTLSFLYPIYDLHRQLQASRAVHIDPALAEIGAALSAMRVAEKNGLPRSESDIATAANRHFDLRSTPEWPVPIRPMIRIVVVYSVTLVGPLVSEFVTKGFTTPKTLVEIFAKALTKVF